MFNRLLLYFPIKMWKRHSKSKTIASFRRNKICKIWSNNFDLVHQSPVFLYCFGDPQLAVRTAYGLGHFKRCSVMSVVFCLHCSSSAGNTNIWLFLFSLPCELGLCVLVVERKKTWRKASFSLPLSPSAEMPKQGGALLWKWSSWVERDVWSRWGAGR